VVLVGSKGKVFLVGAGPGDVELLTLKAVKALAQADVLLIDDLVNRDILQFVRSDARIVNVGKRGGCKSTPQEFIERQMIHEARSGHVVARVKGGDPFVFGRGGEELLALEMAGIEVEVINGITAGIGVPAAIGIPVTHREFCSGVSFVTGHTQHGCDVNWRALVESRTTLVIYMGVGHLADIAGNLIAAGMKATTPACAIQNGTLATQRSVVATLAELPRAVEEHGIASPAMIVIGDVVGFATQQAKAAERCRA
jgi:uroporphyrin-III C-methyltransferase